MESYNMSSFVSGFCHSVFLRFIHVTVLVSSAFLFIAVFHCMNIPLCYSMTALFLEQTLFSLLNYLSTFGNNQLTTYVQIY